MENSSHTLIHSGTRAVVVGAGQSGIATCRLLRRLGAHVRLLERNPERIAPDFLAWAGREQIEILGGEHTAEQFAGMDVIVPSPGVPVSAVTQLVPHARIGVSGQGPELMAETELAWRQLTSEPVVGITGTSGKTTTVTLCAAMLKEQGLRSFIGGNIGTPLSAYVLDVMDGAPRAEVIVLELSSFQLQACSSLRPRVAVLTGITPNHLDHHAGMSEYIEAKMRLFMHQGANDLAVIAESALPLCAGHDLAARRVVIPSVPAPGDIERFSGMQLFGLHNVLNALTAWTACREFGVSEQAAINAARRLEPIPHRLELITERGGVQYINDSKCTTVAALRVALEALDRPVLLLAGGVFKGGALDALRDLVACKVRAVGLYGANRGVFEQAWSDIVPVSYDASLEQAAVRLAGQAEPGDALLLAPATSSYDQYPNYVARGEDFRRIVNEVLR